MAGVHRVASLVKRWILGTHHGAVQPGHLDAYLDEFVFRFNRRTSGSRGMLFYRLLQQAVVTDPVTYADIIVPEQGTGWYPLSGAKWIPIMCIQYQTQAAHRPRRPACAAPRSWYASSSSDWAASTSPVPCLPRLWRHVLRADKAVQAWHPPIIASQMQRTP